MARKKKTKIVYDDISENNEEDITYFEEDAKPEGTLVSLFSFDTTNNSEIQNIQANSKVSNTQGLNTKDNKLNNIDEINLSVTNYDSLSHSSKKIIDNIVTRMCFGSVPPIDGESANVKRSYNLRHSTVIKIDKIKNAHVDANVSVSTIVDMAISHYFNCIFSK